MHIAATSQSSASTAIQAAMAKATEEALETSSETKSEAAKDDIQAQQRLARTAAQAPAAKASAPVAPDGTGEILNARG